MLWFKVPIWNLEQRAALQIPAVRLHAGGRGHDGRTLFEAIRQLTHTPPPPEKRMGFNVRERQPVYGRR